MWTETRGPLLGRPACGFTTAWQPPSRDASHTVAQGSGGDCCWDHINRRTNGTAPSAMSKISNCLLNILNSVPIICSLYQFAQFSSWFQFSPYVEVAFNCIGSQGKYTYYSELLSWNSNSNQSQVSVIDLSQTCRHRLE